MSRSFIVTSPDEMELLGGALAGLLSPGAVVFLKGDLGMGKTVFVKGMVSALGGEGVRSPSFTLINEYDGPIPVAHADLYRLENVDFRAMGLEDYRDDGWIVVVEWPQRLEIIPKGDGFLVFFDLLSRAEEHKNFRRLKIDPLTAGDDAKLASPVFDRWEER